MDGNSQFTKHLNKIISHLDLITPCDYHIFAEDEPKAQRTEVTAKAI